MSVTAGDCAMYTTEDGSTEVVLVIEHLTEKANEKVIDYDFNQNEITVADKSPQFPEMDTVVKCVYPSALHKRFPEYTNKSDQEIIQVVDITQVKQLISENRIKPYYFHSSRLSKIY